MHKPDPEQQQTSIASSPWVKTTCPYCGTGCGVEARRNDDQSVTIRGDESHPTNAGRLCSKGLNLAATLVPQGRLTECFIHGQAQSMETTLSYVAAKFNQVIAEHGPDAVAFYVSGQLLTEDYYVANKLMKGFIGSSNIDSNSRLCMSSAVVAHKRAFGEDIVPGCYADIEQAEHICLVGSNLAWCHPILFGRINQAKLANPALKITVIDPRRTETCSIADQHLAIRPGTDVALFNGLLTYLAQHGYCDRDYIAKHTQGFAATLEAAAGGTPDWQALAQLCNIDVTTMLDFFSCFSETEKTLTLFSQGVNQSSRGTDKANAIINCHLATGRVGKPGASPFSVTGQPNAMGGREVGGLATMLAAHMDFDASSLAVVSKFWQTDKLATQPGAKAIDMFDKLADGSIKAIWIMGTNPAVSLPDSAKIQQALTDCPLVVVSDCIAKSDTLACADVLLPAQGWGEKTGTVTNSERCISRQRGFLPSLGEAKPDWWLIAEVAKRMGFSLAFDYADVAAVFAEYAALSGYAQQGHPRGLDLSALSGQDYAQHSPQQWPIKLDEGALLSQSRVFSDGQFATPSGRANFVPLSYQGTASAISNNFPLVLNTGRNRDQWHSMSRTGLASKLNNHMPEPLLAMNPDDMLSAGIHDADLVTVQSQQGALLVRVHASAEQNPGELFMPIHWSRQNASAGAISSLVAAHTDPHSGQPENKYTPVCVKHWPHAARAALWSQRRLALTQLLPDAGYWVERRLEQGFCYYLASTSSPAQFFNQLKLAFNNSMLQKQVDYANAVEQKYRFASSLQDQLDISLMVTPADDSDDANWLANLQLLQPETGLRTTLKGTAEVAASRMVCACHQVSEQTIVAALDAGATSAKAVAATCQAGSGCGSCIPEIERLVSNCQLVVTS